MIIKEKKGNLSDTAIHNKNIDRVLIEWYETSKRILHKKTENGVPVILKFLQENHMLQQDDILFADENLLIVVDIIPCKTIVIKPHSLFSMATLCYEIGNKHLPLYYDNDLLMVPFDAPLFRWLQLAGLEPLTEQRKLCMPMRTSVMAHAHGGNSKTLFSKILKLGSPNNE